MIPLQASFIRSRVTPYHALFLALALAVGIAACDSGGSNQDEEEEPPEVTETFTVTVDSIDGEDYKYSDQNEVGAAYAINGEIGREITLERGETYEFELGDGVDAESDPHPFYIDNTPEGQRNDPFSEGVENEGATAGSVYFTPPSDAPDSLYYQCESHLYMGGDMEIID